MKWGGPQPNNYAGGANPGPRSVALGCQIPHIHVGRSERVSVHPKAMKLVVALAPLLSPPVGEAGFRSGLSLSQFRHLGPKQKCTLGQD